MEENQECAKETEDAKQVGARKEAASKIQEFRKCDENLTNEAFVELNEATSSESESIYEEMGVFSSYFKHDGSDNSNEFNENEVKSDKIMTAKIPGISGDKDTAYPKDQIEQTINQLDKEDASKLENKSYQKNSSCTVQLETKPFKPARLDQSAFSVQQALFSAAERISLKRKTMNHCDSSSENTIKKANSTDQTQMPDITEIVNLNNFRLSPIKSQIANISPPETIGSQELVHKPIVSPINISGTSKTPLQSITKAPVLQDTLFESHKAFKGSENRYLLPETTSLPKTPNKSETVTAQTNILASTSQTQSSEEAVTKSPNELTSSLAELLTLDDSKMSPITKKSTESIQGRTKGEQYNTSSDEEEASQSSSSESSKRYPNIVRTVGTSSENDDDDEARQQNLDADTDSSLSAAEENYDTPDSSTDELELEKVDASDVALKIENSTTEREDTCLEEISKGLTTNEFGDDKLHSPKNKTEPEQPWSSEFQDQDDFYEDHSDIDVADTALPNHALENMQIIKDYEKIVRSLAVLIHKAPNNFKYEFYQLLYPIFMLVYFKMIAINEHQKAKSYFDAYGHMFDNSYKERLEKLKDFRFSRSIPKRAKRIVLGNEKMELLISQEAHDALVLYINDWPDAQQENFFMNICFKTFDSSGEPKQHPRPATKPLCRVLYAPPMPLYRKDIRRPNVCRRAQSKHNPSNENFPPGNRLFTSSLKRTDLVRRKNDERHRVFLNRIHLPSIYLYSVQAAQSHEVVLCAVFSENFTMLGIGTDTSKLYVFSLTPVKLHQLKPANLLRKLNTLVAGVDKNMLDPTKRRVRRTLTGHLGPVYSCAFALDDRFVLSCSEDRSVRCWCLLSWSCVVIYLGHCAPIHCICYAPRGYYFATSSDDCTVRIWTQDNRQAIRVFSGHLASVSCCVFHPNSHYVASGSEDCTVRIWDVLDSKQVRVFLGHKDKITAVAYSRCGRFLVSGSADTYIIVWDTVTEKMVKCLSHHTDRINSLEFCIDNNLFVAAGQDCQLSVWDFEILLKNYLGAQTTEKESAPQEKSGNPKRKTNCDDLSQNVLVRSYRSLDFPFVKLRVTRRNLLLACCVDQLDSSQLKLSNNGHKSAEFSEWVQLLDILKLKSCVEGNINVYQSDEEIDLLDDNATKEESIENQIDLEQATEELWSDNFVENMTMENGAMKKIAAKKCTLEDIMENYEFVKDYNFFEADTKDKQNSFDDNSAAGFEFLSLTIKDFLSFEFADSEEEDVVESKNVKTGAEEDKLGESKATLNEIVKSVTLEDDAVENQKDDSSMAADDNKEKVDVEDEV